MCLAPAQCADFLWLMAAAVTRSFGVSIDVGSASHLTYSLSLLTQFRSTVWNRILKRFPSSWSVNSEFRACWTSYLEYPSGVNSTVFSSPDKNKNAIGEIAECAFKYLMRKWRQHWVLVCALERHYARMIRRCYRIFYFQNVYLFYFFLNLLAFRDIVKFENVIFLVWCSPASFCFGC